MNPSVFRWKRKEAVCLTNLDPYLAVYFITFVVLILLEVPIAYAMMASAFEFITQTSHIDFSYAP